LDYDPLQALVSGPARVHDTAEGATDEHTDLFPGATDPLAQLALSGAARLLLEDL